MTRPLPQKQLLGKVKIKSQLVVETGVHIGGGEENLDIGGIDKLVVREPIKGHPFLPGSSIKGKLRAILERFLNKPLNRESGGVWRYESDDILDGFTEIKDSFGKLQFIFFNGAASCELSRLFGSTGKDCWVKASEVEEEGEIKKIVKKVYKGEEASDGEAYKRIKGRNAPARLIVRDSHLTDESIKELQNLNTGLLMTERKFENSLDRITAAANPRQIERVPKGAIFDLEMVYTVEVNDNKEVQEDLVNIAVALAILEDDALGGHGSRGYGKVKFKDFEVCHSDYSQVSKGGSILKKSSSDIKLTINSTSDLIGQLDNEKSQLCKHLFGESKDAMAVKQPK